MLGRMGDYLADEKNTEDNDQIEGGDAFIPAELDSPLSEDIQIRIISVANSDDDKNSEENSIEDNSTVTRPRTNSERIGLFCCSLIAFALAGGLGYGGYLAGAKDLEDYNDLSTQERGRCAAEPVACGNGLMMWLSLLAFGAALCCVAGGGFSFRESLVRDERRMPAIPDNNRFFRVRSPSPSVPEWEEGVDEASRSYVLLSSRPSN
jgi:hypothetical protein